MSKKKGYVMLPSTSKSKGLRASSSTLLIFGFLLVVVAAAGWWVGRSSIRTVPPSPPTTEAQTSADPQLAESDSSATSPEAEDSAGPEDRMPSGQPEKFGGITIQSDPAEAKVRIEHMDLGFAQTHVTPVTISELPPGFYDFTVTKEGYAPETGSFEIEAGETQEVDPVELDPALGTLDIQTTSEAQYKIFVPRGESDYEMIDSGMAPAKVEDLPAGLYRLTLTREGWPTTNHTVTITSGMTTELTHTFPEGSISLDSKPQGAEVWIKGRHQDESTMLGKTPLEADGLPAGVYEVAMKGGPGRLRQFLLEVKQGETAEGFAEWKEVPVTFTSDPPGATVFLKSRQLGGEGNATTPFATRLMEGTYEFYAKKNTLEDVRLTATISSDRKNMVHFPFKYGTLQISSAPPGATVTVKNRKVGQTPLMLTHMAPGEYDINVEKERYATRKLTRNVAAGRTDEITINLAYDPMPTAGEDFTNGVGLRMVWVQQLKGWVAATETTQSAYAAIMDQNPSHFSGPDLPVESVTWNEAVRFCETLSISERGQGLAPPGYEYQLPSDEQWTVFSEGTTLANSVTSQHVRRDQPAEAGSLNPNPLGLFDTRGNVWEWCRDWYTQEVYTREQRENASGKPDRMGTRFKVLRGGSWTRSLESNLALGYRLLADPGNHKNYETGFRVVLMSQ